MSYTKKTITIIAIAAFLIGLYSIADVIDILWGPLSTSGNQIVTQKGMPVRLKAVNWFGFESTNLVPHGLWTRGYKDMLNEIKNMGFNTIRLPFCNEMFDKGAKPNSINTNVNPDLDGLNSLQILDKIVDYAESIGLRIILDHHRNDAGMGALNDGLWYTDKYPEERFIADWQMLADRYKGRPVIIGADLHNEPHGRANWGSGDPKTDWQMASQKAGDAIHAKNPDWLIIVEGVENYNNNYYWWGGNLMGVKDKPVKLKVPNKVVYSTHDYPNSIHNQSWFNDPSYPNNLPAKFRQMWGYIFENGIAPIFVGEMGSKFVDPKDAQWMEKITAYLNGDFNGDGGSQLKPGQQGISFAWWSLNPNSGDTGGLLLDDWMKRDEAKLKRLEPLLLGRSVAPKNPQASASTGQAGRARAQ